MAFREESLSQVYNLCLHNVCLHPSFVHKVMTLSPQSFNQALIRAYSHSPLLYVIML